MTQPPCPACVMSDRDWRHAGYPPCTCSQDIPEQDCWRCHGVGRPAYRIERTVTYRCPHCGAAWQLQLTEAAAEGS